MVENFTLLKHEQAADLEFLQVFFQTLTSTTSLPHSMWPVSREAALNLPQGLPQVGQKLTSGAEPGIWG